MLILALEIPFLITNLRMNRPDDNSNGNRPLPPGARPLPPAGDGNPPTSTDDIPTARPIHAVNSSTVANAENYELSDAKPIPDPGSLPQLDSNETLPPAVGNVVLEYAAPDSPVSHDAMEEMVESAKYSAPYWVISFLVHTLILIVLGLVLLPGFQTDQILVEAIFADSIGQQQEEPLEFESPMKEEMVEEESIVVENEEPEVEDPEAAPPEPEEKEMPEEAAPEPMEKVPAIGLALTGREEGRRVALLDTFGGTAITEGAVQKALMWLKLQQRTDGSWSLKGPYTGGANIENKLAATALAILAFQGNGNTHKQGPYKDVVARGWKWLLPFLQDDGSFGIHGGFNHRLYTQAIATIALCELYGMSYDKTFKEPAQRAIDFACQVQSVTGGWRYSPNGKSDTSVTGWFVMALQSARMAGLIVPKENLEKISDYLDSVTVDGGVQYAYRPGFTNKFSMTAEALLCRQYLGWEKEDPRLQSGAQIVAAQKVRWNENDLTDLTNVYAWYYAAQMLHHMDDDNWVKWNEVMRDVIPSKQVKSGREAGSWSPSHDEWGQGRGGRLFMTCFCTFMLEVYYRHMPLYGLRIE